MKKIKLNKKLQLNKETIALLNVNEQNVIKGGATRTQTGDCTTCMDTCCGPCTSGVEKTTALSGCKACS